MTAARCFHCFHTQSEFKLLSCSRKFITVRLLKSPQLMLQLSDTHILQMSSVSSISKVHENITILTDILSTESSVAFLMLFCVAEICNEFNHHSVH